MFNFEKMKSSIQDKKSALQQGIEKTVFIKSDRSSPLPNPMDDTISTTEKFWDEMNSGVYDDNEVIDINPEKALENSLEDDSEKAA